MKLFLDWIKTEWDEDDHAIRGEYWIDENGYPNYADGDIGDVNHEGVVINRLQCQIAGDHYEYGDGVDWERWKKDFAETIYQQRLASTQDPEEREELQDDYEYDPESFIDEEALQNELGIDFETYEYANGKGDAREYGMKHWKWKRVKGHDVETWTFDAQDRKILAEGLANIIHDELGEISEDQIDNMEFYVYVYTNKQSFDVTLGQLEGKTTPVKPDVHSEPITPYQPEKMAQNEPTQQANSQQTFFNFMKKPEQAPQSFHDPEQAMQFRPVHADINQQQKAAQAFTRKQDKENMPSYYKGHIGDWYVPKSE